MLIFDIETGPLPEEQLRQLYVEPTYEEFAASCDSRWKPETVKGKYEELLKTGWQKFVDVAALDPTTGQVLAIGYYSFKPSGGIAIKPDLARDHQYGENELIAAFWQQYMKCHKSGRRMAGVSIFGFDLPFLVRRSWILGIDIPQTVRNGRYFDHIFTDLCDVWLCGQRFGETPANLNAIARALGVGQKNGNGADFARLLAEQPEEAIAYLRQDLELTAACAVRMGVA